MQKNYINNTIRIQLPEQELKLYNKNKKAKQYETTKTKNTQKYPAN